MVYISVKDAGMRLDELVKMAVEGKSVFLTIDDAVVAELSAHSDGSPLQKSEKPGAVDADKFLYKTDGMP